MENEDALRREVEAVFGTNIRAYWSNLLNSVNVPNAPIQSSTEALAHEQIQAAGIVKPAPDGSFGLVANALKLDDQRPGFDPFAPDLGEATDEVLAKYRGDKSLLAGAARFACVLLKILKYTVDSKCDAHSKVGRPIETKVLHDRNVTNAEQPRFAIIMLEAEVEAEVICSGLAFQEVTLLGHRLISDLALQQHAALPESGREQGQHRRSQ